MKTVYGAVALCVMTFSSGAAVAQQVEGEGTQCGLKSAVAERRAEVRDRNRQMSQTGIQERNSAVVDATPTISEGACLDQVYAVMDNVTNSMKSSFGSVFTRELTAQLGKMGCNEADKFYKEVMRTELARFDDQLGIIGSAGEITGYSGNRTSRVDVSDAIELGRKAGSAVTAPMRPPGRGGLNTGEERAVNQGVRDALNNL